jgi:2-succinyl-5-enolpyruvyl-6-hydroxy-3-cyclohexene-1-carboxylate synthase
LTAPADTHLLLRAFVDELVRCGLAGACTSPGSRSTPLVTALVRDGRVPAWSHIDERTAGFFALGAARASGRPVAVTCTSGTAAAHLHPAVIEAWEAGVPLLVLTADRPPELRGVAAGQTIDQLGLFGSSAKWFFEVGNHEASAERLRWMRTLACRAHWTATSGRPGPVHLNFPLREPLVLGEELPGDEPGGGGRADGAPWVSCASLPAPSVTAADAGAGEAVGGRGVVVAGRSAGVQDAEVQAFARALRWPILADALSGARHGEQAVAHYDALLRDDAFAQAHRPDVVVRVGDLPTSKPLRSWLAGLDAHQVAVAWPGAWPDPAGVLDAVSPHALPMRSFEPADEGWLASWRQADERAAGAIAAVLGEDLSEPRVAALLGASLPADATLVVASSMPVRDIETFAGVREDAPRVLANRGANGIDGTIATALGVAAVDDGPVVLLIGDVALAHDIGSLAAAGRLGQAITIVLLDNGGGGIFEFLPVAGQQEIFEAHVATPPGLDVEAVARAFGCAYAAVGDVPGFTAALTDALGAPRTTILHVRTDRRANVALHRAVWAAVGEALRSGPATAPAA